MGLEFANPWVLDLLLSAGEIDEIPSDFARYHLDPAFRASEQMIDAESRRLFGKRLRLLREQQNVMLLALARTIGISPAALIALEEGRESPTATTLQALGKGLRCSFEDLMLAREPK